MISPDGYPSTDSALILGESKEETLEPSLLG